MHNSVYMSSGLMGGSLYATFSILTGFMLDVMYLRYSECNPAILNLWNADTLMNVLLRYGFYFHLQPYLQTLKYTFWTCHKVNVYLDK